VFTLDQFSFGRSSPVRCPWSTVRLPAGERSLQDLEILPRPPVSHLGGGRLNLAANLGGSSVAAAERTFRPWSHGQSFFIKRFAGGSQF